MRVCYFLFFASFFFTFSNSIKAQNSVHSQSTEVLFEQGLEQIHKSNYSAARKFFEGYIASNNNDAVNIPAAKYYLAFAALNLYNNDGEYLIEEFISNYSTHPLAHNAYYELGKFYYAENNPSKTIQYLEKIESDKGFSDKQKTEIKFKLGYSYFSKKKFDEALKCFNTVKNKSGEYQIASNYYAGYIEFETSNYDEALSDLLRAEKSEAYQNIVPHMIAAIHYYNKDYNRLVQYAELKLNSPQRITNMNDVLLLAAEGYYHLENFEKASVYYTKYADRVSTNQMEVPLMYRIGYVAYQGNNNDLAVDMFKRVASLNEENLGGYASYYLGILYAKEGNKAFAVNAFGKARQLKSDGKVSEEAQFQYAKLNYDLGNTSLAIRALNEYTDQFPNGKYGNEISDLMAEAYVNTNDYQSAIQYAKRVGLSSNKVKRAYQLANFHLGVENYNNTDYKKAINYFKQSLEVPYIKEYVNKANYWIAESYSRGGKYEDAVKFYQKILWNADDASWEKSRARYGIGYCFYNTKNYEDAFKAFKLYVDSNTPGSNKFLYNDALIRLADCYYVRKEYSNAISTYKESIALSRVDADYAELQLGIVYGISGNNEEALGYYNRVINRTEKSKYKDDALFYKAQLQFESGDFKAAITGFTKVINSQVGSRFTRYAYLKRALAYYNTKQYDQCIEDYKAIITGYSTHKVAQQALLPLQEVLALQSRSGEFDRYLAIYKRANPDDKSTESVEFEAAKTLYFNQQYQDAASKLKAFLDDYPESGRVLEVNFYLGEVYNKMERPDEALLYYSKILENTSYDQYNRVLGRVAKMEQDQQRFQNALYYYKKLLTAANNRKEQNSAYMGLIECYYGHTAFDSSSYYAETILAEGTANVSDQNRASLYIGKNAMAKGEFQKAQDAFLQTINTAKDAHGAEAQYLIGSILYLQGKYDQAIETLIELNNSYHSYDNWVGKGFLLIVDCYVAKEEFFQAKGTLKSLIEGFPLDFIVDLARVKLKEIEQQEEEERAVELDSTNVLMDSTVVNND